MNYKYFIYAATAMSLVACSNDNDAVLDTPVALTVEANIEDVTTTRASISTFTEGNAIGVTVTAGTSTGTNKKYVYGTSGRFASTDGIYFIDTKKVTIAAYYPYAEAASTSATLEQTTAGEPEDYLFGTGSGSILSASKGVAVTFQHVMSKLTFTFAKGDGVTDDDIASLQQYTVSGLIWTGTFDTQQGTTATTGDAVSLTPTVSLSANDPSHALILYPQTPVGDVTLALTLDGNTYKASIAVPEAGFEAGNNYAYDVKVNRSALFITSATIEPWSAHESVSTSTTYDAPNLLDDASDYGLAWTEEDLEKLLQ
jgi:hypothetical protein